jgi:hypothetical protein
MDRRNLLLSLFAVSGTAAIGSVLPSRTEALPLLDPLKTLEGESAAPAVASDDDVAQVRIEQAQWGYRRYRYYRRPYWRRRYYYRPYGWRRRYWRRRYRRRYW